MWPAHGQGRFAVDGKSHLNHLDVLEDESVFILREVAAEFRNPVILYSIGMDSSVLVHLARKAFYPAPIPFPLLHIDTGYKFKEMIAFRDRFAASIGDVCSCTAMKRQSLTQPTL